MYCFFIGRNSNLDCTDTAKKIIWLFSLTKRPFYNGKESSVYNNINHLVCIMNTLEHGRHLCCQNLTLKVSCFVVTKFQMFLNFANQRLSILVSNTVAFEKKWRKQLMVKYFLPSWLVQFLKVRFLNQYQELGLPRSTSSRSTPGC